MLKTAPEFYTGQVHQIASPDLEGILPHAQTRDYTAAEVIASNATPLVLVSAPGAGYVLVFLEAFLNVHGGSANYDQNQNFIVKYQTAGGGATVSTTLANFMNGAAAGSLKTIKQLTTDITPEQNQDLVLTSSASPYSAAGDRLLQVTTLYYVVPRLSTT